MKLNKKIKLKGFTVIEIMVVCVIIAVLATAGVVSYQKSLAKARDAARIADINTIKNAMEMFYDEHNTFSVDPNPSTTTTNSVGSTTTHGFGYFNANAGNAGAGNYRTLSIADKLKSDKYLDRVPVDPSGLNFCETSSGTVGYLCADGTSAYRVTPLEPYADATTIYKKIGIFARMEIASSYLRNKCDEYTSTGLVDNCNGTSANGQYNMNYTMVLDKNLP